jgi:ATP-dependent Clp protease adaptor protein ClpS
MTKINYLLADEILANIKNSLGTFDSSMTMGDVATIEETIVKTKKPNEWRIIIFDDDKTPIELVLVLLITVFSKTEEEAAIIIQAAQENGVATIGIYFYDIAKTLLKASKGVINDFEATFNLKVPLELKMEEINEE